jgi:CO dehydrogenase/acetyl-CoA synthase alpha subunit
LIRNLYEATQHTTYLGLKPTPAQASELIVKQLISSDALCVLLQFLFAAEVDVMATREDMAEQRRRISSKAFAGEILYKKVSAEPIKCECACSCSAAAG